MLVVEGPDGAGKTTLVKRLQDGYGFEVGKRGTDNRDDLWKVTRPDTYKAIAGEIGDNAHPLIWDRLFWSEMVYYEFSSRTCQFTLTEQMWIKKALMLTSFTILCMPPKELVIENARKDHQMEGVLDRIEQIYDHYKVLFKGYPGHIMLYDYTQKHDRKNEEELAQRVQHHVDSRKARQW